MIQKVNKNLLPACGNKNCQNLLTLCYAGVPFPPSYVCLCDCSQDVSKRYGWSFVKLGQPIAYGPGMSRFNFRNWSETYSGYCGYRNIPAGRHYYNYSRCHKISMTTMLPCSHCKQHVGEELTAFCRFHCRMSELCTLPHKCKNVQIVIINNVKNVKRDKNKKR